MAKEKLIMSWSGGKDSSLALDQLIQKGDFQVAGLLTTVTQEYDRISMHGVRRYLLKKQAEALGLPVYIVEISPQCSNDEYEIKMKAMLEHFISEGIRRVAFGDIFLEDLKVYRDNNLAKLNCFGEYPIWKRDTRELILEFTSRGFRAVVTCVDTQVLDPSFAGREIDKNWLENLPPKIDPCGENGEFHSFVFDGPIFRNQIQWRPGVTVQRGRFAFHDLIPVDETPAEMTAGKARFPNRF